MLLAVVLAAGFAAVGEMDNVAVINGYPVITADPAAASDWYDTEAMYNLYSPLVYPDPAGGVRPHLATSWEAVGGDYTHWRFTLREGVKFHSGYEMTAEDVAFSMTRFIAMGKGNSGPLGQVTAQIVNDYAVDFLLAKPSAIFPDTLALFFVVEKDLVLENVDPNGSYGENGDYGENWLATHDAGTGPYMMTSHIPGQRLDAVRFVDYFEGWSDEGWGERRGVGRERGADRASRVHHGDRLHHADDAAAKRRPRPRDQRRLDTAAARGYR
jgi:peptide/nickel transport system substrate-binding protein